jgi:hypothetical protein
LLQEINGELDKVEAKTKRTTMSFEKLEAVALRYLVIAQQLGLPPDVDKALQLMARAIVIMRQMQFTAAALTATTPLGWALALAMVGTTYLSGMSFIQLASDTR